MMKRLFFVVMLTGLLPMLLNMKTLTGATKLPTLNAKGTAAIDQLLQAAVEKGELSGVVAAITNKDQILYLNAVGKQDVAQKIAMSKDTVFRIASMTKPVTSVAVMMLVEQGKLRLDDVAGKYAPAIKGREVIASFNEKDASYTTRPAKREITIRDLLTNTAGLSYSFTSSTVLSIVQKTGKNQRDVPLLFDPGTKWQYSHATATLGDIVEKLSGQSLEDYFQANIFRPLKMADTSFLLPAEKAGRLVTIHQRSATGLGEIQNPAKFTPTVRGDGGLVSTASDYAAFVQMLLNEGSWRGARLLKPETVRQMRSNQIGSLVVGEMPAVIPTQSAAFPFGAGKDKFGLGFQITMTEGKAIHERSAGSYTWAGIFNTHFWVDHKQGIGVVFLTQELPFYNPTVMDVMRRFERLMYENLEYVPGKTEGAMTTQNSTDFDVNALYAALDAERQSRGMTWQQVAQEISRQFEHTRATPISSSTLLGMREKRVVEGDGVLQMLRWLHRTPETFVPGYTKTKEDTALPQIGSHQILRFDAKAIYQALDARRNERVITWKQVASEIGCSAPSLTRLANGGRVGFPDVMQIFRWLGRPAAAFTRASDW